MPSAGCCYAICCNVVGMMLHFMSSKSNGSWRQNEGALAGCKLQKDKPMMCHFRDTHCERDKKELNFLYCKK